MSTTQPAPTRGPIPDGFRELSPGEETKATDLVWVAGQGPWSSLEAEQIDAGYSYRPQRAPLEVGHFIHVRRANCPHERRDMDGCCWSCGQGL